MNLYNLILKIQEHYSIGAVEFIDMSGISNGMYYDIKNKRKTKLTPKQLNQLKQNFSDFDFNDYFENEKITNNYELDDKQIKEITLLCLENIKDIEKQPAFKMYLESVIAKSMLKFKSRKELDEFLNS